MTTLTDVQRDLVSGKTSVQEIVRTTLRRITERRDLNAVVHLRSELSLTAAGQIDQALVAGKLPPLAGMTVVVKDNIAQKGWPLTCASQILGDFVSPYDATAVERLIQAGAVVVGRSNLDEFGMGSSTEFSRFGPARNPHDPQRVAGGSSGGSAAAVASGLCRAALGTDTGGSVRQPAAFCGVYGLKPTYGRVSRYGLVAFASSLDQIGVLALHLDDLVALFRVIAGKDHRDETSEEAPVSQEVIASNIKGLRVGLPKEYYGAGLAQEVLSGLDIVRTRLTQAGAVLREVSLPYTPYAVPVYYIIANAEAASNLARYDGVRYGTRASDTSSLEEMYTHSRSQGFGDEVKRRIMLGTYALSAGYYEAYYARAQKVRRLIRDDFLKVFQEVDVLLTPTTPTLPFHLGEKLDDPLTMYLSDIFTVSASLAGIPGLVAPVGKTSEGLPLAAQFLSPHFAEDRLFTVAKVLSERS